MKLNTFERVLRQGNYAENTVAAYLYAVRDYYSRYPSINVSIRQTTLEALRERG